MAGAKKQVIVSLVAKTEQFTRQMDVAARKMAAIGKKLESTGKRLTMSVTAPLVALAAVSVKAFAEQEQALAKLNSAIQANGKDVQSTMAGYKQFAEELQRTTVIGDETTYGLLQLAETMQAADPKKAVEGAVALSRALGVNLESAIKMTIQAQQGQFTMLQRYVPALRSATSETEKQAIVQKLFADGMAIAHAETDTASGKLKQLKNTVGDLGEEFGAIIADYLTPLLDRLRRLADRFGELTETQRKNIVRWAALAAAIGPLYMVMGAIIGRIIPAMIRGFATLKTVMTLVTGAAVKMNAAMKANVIGLAIAAITAAVIGLNRVLKSKNAHLKEFVEIEKQVNTEIKKEQAQVNILFEALRKTNKEGAERNTLITKLNDQYGITLKNYKDEKGFLDAVNVSHQEYNRNIKNRIALKINESKLEVLIAEQMEIIAKRDEVFAKQRKRTGQVQSASSVKYQKLLNENRKQQDALIGKIIETSDAMNVLVDTSEVITNTFSAEDKTKLFYIEKLSKEIKDLEDQLTEMVAKGGDTGLLVKALTGKKEELAKLEGEVGRVTLGLEQYELQTYQSRNAVGVLTDMAFSLGIIFPKYARDKD